MSSRGERVLKVERVDPNVLDRIRSFLSLVLFVTAGKVEGRAPPRPNSTTNPDSGDLVPPTVAFAPTLPAAELAAGAGPCCAASCPRIADRLRSRGRRRPGA